MTGCAIARAKELAVESAHRRIFMSEEGIQEEVRQRRSTYELMWGFLGDVCTAPIRIAPEKPDGLPDWVYAENPSWLEIVGGKAQFSAVPGEEVIQASSAGLASAWLVARAALILWDVYDKAVDRHFCVGTEEASKVPTKNVDLGFELSKTQFNDILEFARALMADDRYWPEGVSFPDPSATLDQWEGRINNLFLGAVAWIVLHELGHKVHQDTGLVGPVIRTCEEFEADRFATSHVLGSTTVPETHRTFRFMSVVVALVWLGLKDTVSKLLPPEVQTHPPAYDRLWSMLETTRALDEPASDEHTYAGVLIKAVFNPGERSTSNTPQDLLEEAFDLLVGGFRTSSSPAEQNPQ